MPKTLRVLMVEPHESPHELFITDQLDDLQETVGGLIEVIGNGDGTILVCNDEAKLNGICKRKLRDGLYVYYIGSLTVGEFGWTIAPVLRVARSDRLIIFSG